MEKLLTFEIDNKSEKLCIHANRLGLEALRSYVDRLLVSKTIPENSHLMTADWGGNELTSKMQGESVRLIHHVKMFLWE